ncbi:hypothetical protein SAMN02910436_00860 [Ruminococcaceae bacterium P7]|nr:hypothetical protein SAMN02910436_00860 [Ruminococcaceae bacterium P7]
MGKIDLSEMYKDIQEEMIASLNLSSPIPHPTMKGDATEYDWINFFSKYLPKRYSVDKGIIIDSNGDTSDQIDIIIYDTQYSYFVFNKSNENNKTVIIPAESVYAIFEVKPMLNKANMKYAEKKAASVRKLYRTSVPIRHAGGYYPPKELHEILAGLLTTKFDWSSPIQDNVIKKLNEESHYKRLDLVCSIDRCTVSVNTNTFIKDYNKKEKYDIEFCEAEHSLIFLLISLLKKLQDIGTAPAIDFEAFKKPIETNKV